VGSTGTVRLGSPVNIREAFRHGSRTLAEAGNEEASLEAELLLAHALKTDRTHLYQRLHEELPRNAAKTFEALLQRRLAHEPTAYILGRKEFYGLEMEVTPAAIIPRPETETLVELVLEFVGTREAAHETQVVDVGVGCGAVAIALAVNLPEAEIVATDISPEALALARRNAERHGVAARIRFLEGDLLEPLDAPVDVIAANLPYVRTGDFEAAPPEIRQHEPLLGLDGGPDGLRIIERLLRDAPDRLRPGGALFIEIGEEQGEAARRLAAEAFPQARIEVRQDLSGLDRVLAVRT
jgi:release factor glutamine methyltransferase